MFNVFVTVIFPFIHIELNCSTIFGVSQFIKDKCASMIQDVEKEQKSKTDKINNGRLCSQ